MTATAWDDIRDWLGDASRPAGRIVVVLLLALVLSRLLKRLLRRAIGGFVDRGSDHALSRIGLLNNDEAALLRRTQRVDALVAVTSSFITVALWALAVMMVLGAIGIDLGPLIAGAGIAGVAIGFGAQSIFRDLFSGALMLLEDQFGVGDIIDVGPASGVVESVSLRVTRIRSVDGTAWHVPNGEIRRVGNMSQVFSRAVVDVGVSYDTDLDLAIDTLREVADEVAADQEFASKITTTPEVWGVERLGESSVDVRLVVTTLPAEQWSVGRELRKRIKQRFDRVGIDIPFPQVTVTYPRAQPSS
jgi:small conductance mechanosensitive channel